MSRPTKNISRTFRMLRRAALVAALIGAPVLAVPSLAGSRDTIIEAPASRNPGLGFVLLVSLQRGGRA